MFCSKCGKEIADNSMFCPECGKEIPSTELQDKSKNLSDIEPKLRDDNIIRLLPELDAEEIMFLNPLVEDMKKNQLKLFAEAYRLRRKDNVWIFLLLGVIGIGGVHRFVLGEIGMGLIYLFTYSLCGIGLLIDLINQNSLVGKYNKAQAINTARVIKATIDD